MCGVSDPTNDLVLPAVNGCSASEYMVATPPRPRRIDIRHCPHNTVVQIIDREALGVSMLFGQHVPALGGRIATQSAVPSLGDLLAAVTRPCKRARKLQRLINFLRNSLPAPSPSYWTSVATLARPTLDNAYNVHLAYLSCYLLITIFYLSTNVSFLQTLRYLLSY